MLQHFIWIFLFFILLYWTMTGKNENNAADINLLLAAQANDVKTIDLFFKQVDEADQAAQVNIADPDGVRPIMYASFYGNIMFVQQLIQAGAEVNCVEKRGWTPLMYAVRYGRLDVTQELVMCDAELEMQNDEGHTALMIAAKYGQIDILNFLMNHGADPDQKDSEGFTAMQLAQDKGYKIIVETLKDKMSEREKGE
jgi:ankyrin repeat protein